jgi:hypothetical protein
MISGILSKYEEMMRMTGSIFQTQKIPSNNSNFKAVQSVIIKEGRQTDDVEKQENLNESA